MGIEYRIEVTPRLGAYVATFEIGKRFAEDFFVRGIASTRQLLWNIDADLIGLLEVETCDCWALQDVAAIEALQGFPWIQAYARSVYEECGTVVVTLLMEPQ